jgi:hypothetical protein
MNTLERFDQSLLMVETGDKHTKIVYRTFCHSDETVTHYLSMQSSDRNLAEWGRPVKIQF